MSMASRRYDQAWQEWQEAQEKATALRIDLNKIEREEGMTTEVMRRARELKAGQPRRGEE